MHMENELLELEDENTELETENTTLRNIVSLAVSVFTTGSDEAIDNLENALKLGKYL